MDVFYLQPECSSSAESPVWYTSASLDRGTLENMLVRVLLVKDVYDKDCYELDEDTDWEGTFRSSRDRTALDSQAARSLLRQTFQVYSFCSEFCSSEPTLGVTM